ncbi:LacI family DNA-binding transcriptional regulator [Microvirga arsenatis]|uniref:Substrate-binding domain-containing protein n=1 Tax=Microvirga arsenatis TaxID=2692265 RepID=A0ABW9YZ70_9HYPH|nr:LacI family DNA-binding transcriptional regulator [Microvirga arsenatis]NBJ11421.1 substrate-binding domain-containing protein [Microvirga arsenatis]NBJ25694.1 substrate-binding domain-containing protein [Microvirga arsenatis]
MSRKRWRSVKEIRIADVARLAGVSTATVSRVLSDPDKVRKKTHDLVMEAVRRSGYIPNSTAQKLRTRRTMNVLVVAPRLTNPVFAEVLRGVDDELTESGYGIIIGNLDNRREREARYVDLALSRQVDGVLLLTGYIPGNGRRSMKEAGLPIVGMCAAIDDRSIPNVVVQDRESARRAVEYLVRLGHRRLGYISGTIGSIIETERYAGFCEGIAEAGLGAADFVRWEGPFVFSTGVAAAEGFLQMKERPTGIFAACDESAIGFIKRVRAERIRVPQDVSVIGFDGIEFADYTEPALTTFRQPLYELGRTGADVLMRMIGGEMRPEDWSIRLEPTLLERGTTGPVLHKDFASLRRSRM